MKKLIIQFFKFIGISGIGWLLDFGTYTCLELFFENLTVNNMISSWIGLTFTFLFSTRKVFENNSKIKLRWKYLIYLLYQCILILTVSKAVSSINLLIVKYITVSFIQNFSYLLAKIGVTPFTMILNYLVMKLLMEKI